MHLLTYPNEPDESEVVRICSTPEVTRALCGRATGGDVRATTLSEGVFQVEGPAGNFVVRFARNYVHLAALHREARLAAGLRGRITLAVPYARVVDGIAGCPPFAIHAMITGEPLTTELYMQLSPPARARLVADLARYFREMHAIPMGDAGDWLDIAHVGQETLIELAKKVGKPVWFGPDAVVEIRRGLGQILDRSEAALFEETVSHFEALGTDPALMVFGHGDVHGYNVAMGADALGPKLVGVFDLGNAGILDVNEDFFRLNLISEELLVRVVAAYQALPGEQRALNRERIAIYYRAFLFYLMAEVPEEELDHLKMLLRRHGKYNAQADW